MRDLLYPEVQLSDPDPVRRAQNAMARHVLPKRFYQTVSIMPVDGRFAIQLDGRGAKTPGRKPLSLPTEEAARIVAAEWEAQKDVIDPSLMPATRLVHTALDAVVERMTDVAEDAAKYAASDLVCYRVSDPAGLAELQDRHWNPVLDWARNSHGASFALAQGIIHAQQPPETLARIHRAVANVTDPIALSALHMLTTISGSVLIALMTASGPLGAEQAWEAAIVDESWQASLWGWDEEAVRRIAQRRADFLMAQGMFQAVR